MCSPTLLNKFFSLDENQKTLFEALDNLYRGWNEKINLISRKDIDNLYLHHVLHSLAIAKVLNFKAETSILDVGTGGGFPGIPLAILFPQCRFVLIDSIEKKIKAAENIVQSLNLTNVKCKRERAEEEKDQFDFVVSRATMPLPILYQICKKNIASCSLNAMPNGFIVLKGGSIHNEVAKFKNIVEVTPVSNFFDDAWFDKKYVVYVPC